MKAVLILLMFSVLTAFTGNNTIPIEVNWSKDFKLTRQHFVSVQSMAEKRAATISTGISINYNYNGTYKARVTAYMNTRESLMLSRLDQYQVDIILNHEKRHFDVTEYIARCMNSELRGVSDMRTINNVYNHYINKLDSMQMLYDAQSDHCLNNEGQKMWDNKLDSLLKLK